MSFAGLKKQLNKANQYVSEKVGKAEGTKLEDEFVELERKTDVTVALVEQVLAKSKDYLQPNPAVRVKMSVHTAMHGDAEKYPQSEKALGEVMERYGYDLGDDSQYGLALVETGNALKHVGSLREDMEVEVHRAFMDPLTNLHDKDFKELQMQRKKLQGRRLDYDCKKRKGNKLPVEERKVAEWKFLDSKEICRTEMTKLMDSEPERLRELHGFVMAMMEWHKNCGEVLSNAAKILTDKVVDAEEVARRMAKIREATEAEKQKGLLVEKPPPGARSPSPSRPENPPASPEDDGSEETNDPDKAPVKPGKGKALFEFTAEKDEELSATEGEMITLLKRVDENWFKGEINGKEGIIPVSYVEVTEEIQEKEQ